MTDLKNMTEKELNEELNRANNRLSAAETEFVSCQNMCNILETELSRRHEKETRGVSKEDIKSIVERWSTKIIDIQRAADSYRDDPESKHSLTMLADILKSCIADLDKLMSGSQTIPNRT